MKLNGRCHCGAITFTADADPHGGLICHCTDCQTLSGSPFRTVIPVAEADFELLGAAPKEYLKTAENGNPRIQAFCGECGTPIYATSTDTAGRIFNVRTGCLEQRADIKPRAQIWHRSSQGWLAGLEEIETIETQ